MCTYIDSYRTRRLDVGQLFLGQFQLVLVLLNVLLLLVNGLLEAIDLLIVEAAASAGGDRSGSRGAQPLVGLVKVNLQINPDKGIHQDQVDGCRYGHYHNSK